MNLETYLAQPIPVQPWLRKFFRPEEKLVIFDIGACEGEESIRYSRLFPDADIYSFEPLKKNFQLAIANFKRFNKSDNRLFNIALGDTNGEASFFVSSGQPAHVDSTVEWDYGNKSGSILPPTEHTTKAYQWLSFQEGEKVALRRLDDFCAEQGVRHINFIHMDVQGAELKVLEGAGELLPSIDLIWMEVAAKEFYRGQPLKSEVLGYMKNRGFKLVFNHEEGNYGDHLYASSKFFSERKSSLDLWERIKIGWMNR